jgi:chromosome segregation ATPase
MTTPKPLFTAEDFPHAKYDKTEAKAIADIANAKVAPLQAEVERAFSALRDLKDHGVKQQGEIERLREKNESLRIKHGSAMIECTRSLKEIDVLRARVADLEAEQGRYIREIIDPLNAKAARLVAEGNELRNNLTATNALVRALREALEFYAMPEHVWVRSAALAADKGYTARKALGTTVAAAKRQVAPADKAKAP